MKKLFYNITILFFALFVIFWIMDTVFTYVFKKGNYTKIQWLYKIENQHYDIVVNGSSRAFTTIDLRKIENETSLKSINISVDGSSIPDQYLMLKIFIEHHNTVKQLYLQIDPFSSNTNEIFSFAIPKFFPYIKDKEVWDHYRSYGSEWYAYRYIPFYRYAKYNTIWGIHEVVNDYCNIMKPDFDTFGDYFYPNITYNGPVKLRSFLWDLNGKYNYLNKIVGLCKENGIALTLFTAPVADIQIDYAYKRNISIFTKIMAHKGVRYINYGDIYGNKAAMFYNEIHLNTIGAEDFTQRIKLAMLTDSSR